MSGTARFDARVFSLINFQNVGLVAAAEGKFVRAETRHQLKQDKFSKVTIDAAEATAQWSIEHRSKLIAGVIALAVIVAAVVGIWYYLDQQDQKAGVDLSRALRTLNTDIRPAGTPAQLDFPSFGSTKERATEARKQFQAVIDRYPHTHAAQVARYFVGRTSADLGDHAAAERAFQEVASVGNDDLAALARLALASVYINNGRTKDAIEIYKDLAQNPTDTVAKTAAQMSLAEAYQAAGMSAEAKKQYQQIQKESPNGPAAQIAAEKLEAMK